MARARRGTKRASRAELEALVVDQAARIAELESVVAELRAALAERDETIAELRRQLAQNPRNSSRPPSSEGYSKPPVKKDRSLRERSGRKPGGQEGHEGAYLEPSPEPDRRIVHEPEGPCSACGADLQDAEDVGEEIRQVFDIPEELALKVIEHAAKLRRCQACGEVNAGPFPHGVGAPVQYGAGLRALGVYLHVFQHIPYDRACQMLSDLAGARVSTATLQGWVDQAARGLTDFDAALRSLLRRSPVVCFDETGARISGRLGWVHSASTETLTRYTSHEKRGTPAMDDAGVLPDFGGIAVHDGWKPYESYTQAAHALCSAHHLRELLAAEEAGQAWAAGMGALLLDAHDAVAEAKDKGRRALAPQVLAELHASYRTVIAAGYKENPGLQAGKAQVRKRSKAQNLLLRLDAKETEALRFAHDFRVPFTNNLSERDIRMVKLQQKISGSWRTEAGAERYLRIRSYIATARKQGERPLAVLGQLASGRPWMPASAPG